MVMITAEAIYSKYATPIHQMFETKTPYDWDVVLHMASDFDIVVKNGERHAQNKANFSKLQEQAEEELAKKGEEGDDFEEMKKDAQARFKPQQGDMMRDPRRDIFTKPPVNEQEYDPLNPPELNTPLWGDMIIKRPVLNRKLDFFDMKRAKSRATLEGAIPRYPHRAFSDGRIFNKRRKTPGGSVLIDDSGSMHLAEETLEAIIKAAPAVVIGAYSGNYTDGQLSILAENGKWCRPAGKNMPAGANNLVDFPALQWLAEQPAPRIWVTDGYVVPRDENRMYEAYVQCIEFCYANDINRVDSASDAHRVFTGKHLLYR
jgi:hypothetical protein